MYEVEIYDRCEGYGFWIEIDAGSIEDAELQARCRYGLPRYGVHAVKAEEVPYPATARTGDDVSLNSVQQEDL